MTGCVLLGVGVAILAARYLHRRHHGCGSGWGWGRGRRGWWRRGGPDAGWDEDEPWERARRGGGFWVRLLSRRLDATPAQEKVMREAVRELAGAASKLGDEAERTRADLAGAFRKSSLDEVMLGELFARHDRALEELRKAFVGAAARIHETLDDEQRARLGDLLESGWHDRRRRGGHHPWHWHRSHHHHRDGAGAGHADARADLD